MDTALEIRCNECGATVVVEPNLRTAECAYCGSHAVVQRPAQTNRPDPTFVVPFVTDHEHAVATVQAWSRARGWFADPRVRRAAIEKVRGIYLPAYLHSAVARARFRAEIGEHYQVTETYTTTENGQTVTKTRTRTEVEWRPLSGSYATYITDILVTASNGLDNADLALVEPFDLRSLRRYEPALLAGWMAEDPSLTREDSLQAAHRESDERLRQQLVSFLPGDQHRGLAFEASVEQEAAELVLLPVWVLAVRYAADTPCLRILVNGQTNEVVGRVPKSWPRIVAAILLTIVVVVGLVLLARRF